MNFVGFVERHGRSIILAAFALAIAGMVSAASLPVGLFPQVSFPRVVVDLDAGSRPADQMALRSDTPRRRRPSAPSRACWTCARPVLAAPRRSRSTSAGGATWSSATLLVDAAIAQILPSLPPGTAI